MRSRRDAWTLVALVVVIVLLALLVGSREDGGGYDPRPSTYVSSELGARALHDVLQELKIPSERRTQPLVDGGPIRGPLIVLAPVVPPTPAEVHALADWVRGGGTLIYAARRKDTTLDSLGLRLRSFSAGDTLATIFEENRSAGETATAEPGRLTEGVGTVDGFRRGFDRASPALRGATVLASRGGVPVVIDARMGKGRVIAWADALPLVNARLKASRAAILFARTTADAANGKTVWFDEYHHGFQGAGNPVAGTIAFLTSERMGRALLQVSVALLGLLLLLGRRFGRPLPPPPARRRSPLEHVDALAGAYRQAHAKETARRLLIAGLARRLGRRVPATQQAEDELLERLAAHPTAGEAARALRAEWKKGRDADLLALSRDVDRYLEEVSRT